MTIARRSALPSLSEQENDALLRLAKSGDDEAREKFFAHNERLMLHVAKKFENTRCEWEERVSSAQMGFLKAYNTFDFAKEIKFATYSTRCMENEILMYLRGASKREKNTAQSLDEIAYAGDDGNEKITFAHMIGVEDDHKFVEISHLRSVLAEFCKTASDRDQQIIHMKYNEEMLQHQIAEALNISQSYISRLEVRLLGKLQKISARQLEEEKNMKQYAGKLYWLFEHTALNNSEIAKVMGISSATVGNYKKFFTASKLEDLTLDPTAEDFMREYYRKQSITQPKVKPQVEAKQEIEEAPVKTYFINPDPAVKAADEAPKTNKEILEAWENNSTTTWTPVPPKEEVVQKDLIITDIEQTVRGVIDRLEGTTKGRLSASAPNESNVPKSDPHADAAIESIKEETYPKSINLVLTSVDLAYIIRGLSALQIDPNKKYDLVLTVKETPSGS